MSLDLETRMIGNETFDDLLRLCWPRQECSSCLKHSPCSWCPTSSTCVPNKSKISILAPMVNADICPLWSERWELRSTLGCHVSTITLLTCFTSVLATFLTIGLAAVGVGVARGLQVRWKTRSDGWWRIWQYYHQDWWRGWRFRLLDTEGRQQSERRPLLE